MKRTRVALGNFLALVFASAVFPLFALTVDTCERSDFTELGRKLNAQWQRFSATRELALLRQQSLQPSLTRNEWEGLLALPVPFTAQEVQQLRWEQDQQVALAQKTNQRNSTLDLAPLRGPLSGLTKDFCADFPKGGMLHIHPWGTLSSEAIQRFLTTLDPLIRPSAMVSALDHPGKNGELYPSELNFLRYLTNRYGEAFHYEILSTRDKKKLRKLCVLPPGDHSFSRFEAVFSVLEVLLTTTPHADPTPWMYQDFFQRAQREKVSYVELTGYVAPSEFSLTEEWATEVQRKYGIKTKILQAFGRRNPLSWLGQEADELIAAARPPTVVGANIVGDESLISLLEPGQVIFLPLLRYLATTVVSTLHLSMHAGEMGDLRNVRDALILGAERIGHGTRLIEDPISLEYARLNKVPIEVSLTSNLRLRGVKHPSEHPYLYYLRLGLPVSLSTDDEGIFETNINQECELAVSKTDINYSELRQLAINSLESAFSPPTEMAQSEKNLNLALAQFESRWALKLPKPASF